MADVCTAAQKASAQQILKQVFDSLRPEGQEALCRVLSLSEPDAFRSDSEYRQAWENLLRLAPQAGRPMLYHLMGTKGVRQKDPVLTRIFENHEMTLVESGQLPAAKIDETLRAFLAYREHHPDADLLPALQAIRSAWEMSGPCFVIHNYPVETSRYEAAQAQHYLYEEFTLAGLKRGECGSDDLKRIVKSLSFGGATVELLESVVKNQARWPDDSQFRENFMKTVRATARRSPKIDQGVEKVLLALKDDLVPADGNAPPDFHNSADALRWLLEGAAVSKREGVLQTRLKDIPLFAVALRLVIEPILQGKSLDDLSTVTKQMEQIRTRHLSKPDEAVPARLALQYLWDIEIRLGALINNRSP